MFRIFLSFVVLFCLIQSDHVAIAKDGLNIGDPVAYSVKLPTADSVMIIEPAGMPVRILPLNPSHKSNESNFNFSAAVYDTGAFTIPPLAVLVFANGQVVDTIWTEPREVIVASLLSDTATTPLPIKPYEEHPLRFADIVREFWPWAVGGLALAGLIYAWIRYRNRAKNGDAMPELPQIPPYDLAIRELIALRDKRYPERGMLKEQYSEFSEILRRYIEGQYEFPALEMTTYELADELKRDDLPQLFRTELLPVLRESDLVKFAKHLPTLADANSIVELGFKIVEQTRPTAVEIKVEQAA